jgi:hypothetical protein
MLLIIVRVRRAVNRGERATAKAQRRRQGRQDIEEDGEYIVKAADLSGSLHGD